MKIKSMFITGSRADFGLLKDLILRFQNDENYESYVVATGAHLMDIHGKTKTIIQEDGIRNIIEADLELMGDSHLEIATAISVGIKKFSDIFERIKPDFITVLGDRYELWAACIPATVFNIPIVHIHGGEVTFGAIDDVVRHTLTKMGHLHFTSTEEYRKRVLQMGEKEENAYYVGAIGLDRIREMNFISKVDLEKMLSLKFNQKNILCTFHPVTMSKQQSREEISSLIQALDFLLENKEITIFVTLPNADTDSNYIRKEWEKLVHRHPKNVFSFTNLGDQRYLSLMKNVDLVLGNSSSGIIEAPFLKKAVVNIGVRQKGRLTSAHVIHCASNKDKLIKAIEKALSDDFQKEVLEASTIYGEGYTVEKIYEIIKRKDFKQILNKEFADRQ